MTPTEYYQNRINSLKIDLDHIKHKIELSADKTEISKLKDEKVRILDEILNYQGALDRPQ